jgi:predicted secreted protein
MRHRHALLAVMLVLAPLAAPLGAARAESSTTKQTLSETATVLAVPDELSAVLRAEATAATAAEAQRQVNAAMADALAEAKKVASVTASTGGYDTYRDSSTRPERWRAGQALALRSADGAALLTLVGTLQQAGLAVGELHWQLSDDGEHRAKSEATRRAVAALRARADEAAGLLGLVFVRFDAVRLELPAGIRPMMRMMAVSPSAQAPPSAISEDIPVSVTVGADAVLAPK